MTDTITTAKGVETPLPRQFISSDDSTPKFGYFQQSLPAQLIIFSFLFLTIPLVIFTTLWQNALLMWTYTWLFGMTHFVVTFVVYCQSRNLKHFTSSAKNVLIYFAIPVAIFLVFDLLHAFRVGIVYPTFALFFWGAIRALDFNHFNRQTFGVYQLFKARAGLKTVPWMKFCENGYFHSLSALMFVTFLSGGTSPFLQPWIGTPTDPVLSQGWAQVLAGLAALSAIGFLAASMMGFRIKARESSIGTGRKSALFYFAFQSASALFAIISLPLYLAALAMHYVEYHVLMVPRTLHIPLDETSRIDRIYGKIRSQRWLFYSIVFGLALIVTMLSYAGMGVMGRTPQSLTKPFDYLVMIAVFDGLFVFHYFIEMFIWRFSDPHYRQALAGLYFAPKK